MEEEKEGDAICMRVTSIASRSLCSSRSFKCQCQVATDGRTDGGPAKDVGTSLPYPSLGSGVQSFSLVPLPDESGHCAVNVVGPRTDADDVGVSSSTNQINAALSRGGRT